MDCSGKRIMSTRHLYRILMLVVLWTFCLPAFAEPILIRLESGHQAILSRPTKPPVTAGIYVHGLIVEKIGAKASAEKGYDVAAFVKAFAEASMIGIAPLREAGSSAGSGIRESLRYLHAQHGLPKERVYLVGFSRGGALVLEHLESVGHTGPVALLSPALPKSFSFTPNSPVKIPILITLGDRDPSSIRNGVPERLIPALKSSGAQVTLKDSYPGDHRWFWKVQPKHWPEVVAFAKSLAVHG